MTWTCTGVASEDRRGVARLDFAAPRAKRLSSMADRVHSRAVRLAQPTARQPISAPRPIPVRKGRCWLWCLILFTGALAGGFGWEGRASAGTVDCLCCSPAPLDPKPCCCATTVQAKASQGCACLSAPNHETAPLPWASPPRTPSPSLAAVERMESFQSTGRAVALQARFTVARRPSRAPPPWARARSGKLRSAVAVWRI